MDHTVTERRRDARFDQASLIGMRATLRPGCVVSLVNLSAGGALVEATRPLRPGAGVHVQLVTPRRLFAMAAHILRCAVWAVDAEAGVSYRAALRFEHPCDVFWERSNPKGSALPVEAALERPTPGHSRRCERD